MTIRLPDLALVARFRRDLEALTGPEPGRLGVAVSGGADSLALLLLAWAAYGAASSQGRRRVVRAISIDHGLRPEAADECRFVGEICASLGVAHDIIPVEVRPSGNGLQAAARVARRDAYRAWAEQHRLDWLLTGHHADDQAETILMRLARGAGVGGLAGMPPLARIGGTVARPIQLLRPLLGWSRAELAAIVRAAGVTPVADPSNTDPRFDRSRFRALLASTDLLEPHRLANAARHIRDADEALGWVIGTLADRIVVEGADRVTLAVAAWPREILRRMVLDAFAALAAYPDGPGTMRLINLLEAGRTATLAGIKVVPGHGTWTFTRAPPRGAN